MKEGFNKAFYTTAKTVIKNLRADNDFCIAITGDYEGIGKSTLAIHLAMEIDKRFNIKENVLFQPTHKELKEKLSTLPKYSVIVADEAIRILHKQEWYKPDQLYLNKVYALGRQYNQATIFCMPSVHDFNKFFREQKLHLWINVFKRGWGMVITKWRNPAGADMWLLKDVQKTIDSQLIRSGKTSITPNTAMRLVHAKRARNIISIIRFPDLDKKVKKEYVSLKSEHQLEAIDDELDPTGKSWLNQRDKLLWWIRRPLGFKEKTIATFLDMPVTTIGNAVRKVDDHMSRDERLVNISTTTTNPNIIINRKKIKYFADVGLLGADVVQKLEGDTGKNSGDVKIKEALDDLAAKGRGKGEDDG